MAKQNETIIRQGRILNVTKLEVITIGLGLVSKLKMAEGLIWKNDSGATVVKTKEAPQGQVYDQDLTLVVRILDGQVLIDGMYDMYCPPNDKVEKLLSKPFKLETLTEAQLAELKPLFDCGSNIRPSIAPADPGRKAILITLEMVGSKGYIECVDRWNEESGQTTKLYPGDYFLVEDVDACEGYRIGGTEFGITHKVVSDET